MNKKPVLIIIFLFLCFFAFFDNIEAKDDGKCNKYFTVEPFDYSEGVAFNSKYDKGDLNSGHFINGKTVAAAGFPWTSTARNVTAWYYRTKGDKKFSSSAQLAITVYNTSGNLCTTVISGFSTSENHVKVVLNHTGKNQWVNIKGSFTDNDNISSSTISSDIKIDTKEPLIALTKDAPTYLYDEVALSTMIDFFAEVTDPNSWGKYDSISLENISCTGISSNFISGSCNDSTIKECLDDDMNEIDCKKKRLDCNISISDELTDGIYDIAATIVAKKKSGVTGKKVITFKYNANDSRIITTATTTKKDGDEYVDEDGNKLCPNGTYKDKNGACSDENGVNYGATLGSAKNTDKSYNIENGNIGCTTTIQDIVDEYWKYIMILVPVGLIILITFDFVKAITSSSDDQLKKSSNDALKRTISTVILLMLPVLLKLVLGWFGIELCI